MLDLSILNKYDPTGMHKTYDKWPQIAKESYESNHEPLDLRDINNIVFAGMGGSGAVGDVFSSILTNTKMHVYVVKGYLLPKTVDSNTLVVATSVSGNTVETLTILDSAKKLGSKIIAFSSGGKIQEYCEKNKIQYRNIVQIHSPRASFPNYLYSMMNILKCIIPVPKHDIDDSIEQLKNLQNKISSSNLNDNNLSLEIAEWIQGIPMIYYPKGLQAAAIRFKNSIQENAKSHVMAEDVIEASHNGIVSWEKSNTVQPILLEGQDDYIKTKQRWQIFKEYFVSNSIEYKEIFSIKGSILSKLVHLIYLLDYAAIYMAVSRKIDPSPVQSIDFVKDRLGF